MSSTKQTPKMLRGLKAKIVAAIMVSSGIVIVAAMSAMLVLTYRSDFTDIDHALSKACEVGPSNVVLFNVGKSDKDADDVSVNTFMPTATFFVNTQGEVINSNESFVVMDESVRDEAISAVLSSSKSEGRVPEAGVFYKKVAASLSGINGYVIAFADSTAFDAEIGTTALRFTYMGAIFLVALLAVSILLARVLTHPIQRAWQQQSEFIANASHELKTPLTVLIANNDIMMAHPEYTADERAVWLEGNRVEAEHMRGLIEDMLTLAREDAAPLEKPAFVDVDLTGLVERSSLAFDAVAFEHGVMVDEQVDPNITIKGDEQSLERMVKTLVDNAVKYAGKGGRVTVRLSASHADHPVLEVTNTGEPIPAEDIPHVFDRFWRSDAARSRSSQGGYGLGLSIAKTIADDHGATISVKSDVKNGTTFRVEF